MNDESSRKRRRHYGIIDKLATHDEIEKAKREGIYDPRPASGSHLARRVIVRCDSCGAVLAEVHDFEHRMLVHSLTDQRWYRGLRGMKCRKCYGPLDLVTVDGDVIQSAIAVARDSGRTKTVKVGRLIPVDSERQTVDNSDPIANSAADFRHRWNKMLQLGDSTGDQ